MLRLRKSALKTPGKNVQVLSVEKYASRLTLPFIEGAGLDASAFAAVRELLGDGPAIAESHRIAQQVGVKRVETGLCILLCILLGTWLETFIDEGKSSFGGPTERE